MSYSLAPDHVAIRGIRQSLVRDLNGILPAAKIQRGTLRAFFKLVNNNRTHDFLFGQQDKKVLNDMALEHLLSQNDCFQTFALGIGIMRVPIVGGVEQLANAVFITDPNHVLFTVAERTSMAAIFNAVLLLKTNQQDRIQQWTTNDFLTDSTFEDNKTMKPRMSDGLFVLAGGNRNQATITLASIGDISNLAGVAGTSANYLCFQMDGHFCVGDGVEGVKSIVKALTGE